MAPKNESWADIAAHNVPKGDHGAVPPPELLVVPEQSQGRPVSPNADDLVEDKVHVVDRDEIEKLREAVSHADEPHSVDADFREAQEHQAQRDQAQLKAQAQAELKQAKSTASAEAEKAADKGEEILDDVKRKGKQLEKDAAGAYQKGKEEIKEFADKAEREAKKDAKKLQRKASEVEREGRALAKQHPYAASGLVGVTNLLLVAVPAYFAYKHWNEPRWDRRVVSAVGVGLAAIFGAEGALGWFEYEKEHGRK
ncbi:hypothetical protein Rhopal_003298-T1 [Rhodotorula paludigena]|uniref:Mitochondrial outer membrane protein OM14 C-terminal domain-containing protein n=1 Tax=Rhodotorula paludigena TaxID=86838 RepID=A0AAV5GCK9_9BASI|nr:hypothetical protein Rhopal_003298-T1 [Rhodotorula paludigena]